MQRPGTISHSDGRPLTDPESSVGVIVSHIVVTHSPEACQKHESTVAESFPLALLRLK